MFMDHLCHTLFSLHTCLRHAGADDFTPVLIYVTIKAQTPYLASNLAYIERYRYHPKLTAEAQYYFIQLVRRKCGSRTDGRGNQWLTYTCDCSWC